MSNGGDEWGARPPEWGWDPAYWETRAGHWGPPGIFLPRPLARVGERYPLNPAYLEQMMRVPITYTPFGERGFYWPTMGRLFLGRDMPRMGLLHEYGHAMEPPGFAPAYGELMGTGEYPLPTSWYDWGREQEGLLGRSSWRLQRRVPGALESEAYATYPPLHFTPEPLFTRVPEKLRQYYPWLRWDVPSWSSPRGY